jgi:hypothetical protein
MSADPPRYSQRHFNWEEPVAPDGSIPLDYLLGWLKTNLTSFARLLTGTKRSCRCVRS